MNKINAQSIALRARDKARSLRMKMAGAAGIVTTALYSGLAFAQATPPDTSAIESEFDMYKAAVVVLVIAFAAVLWAIRGAGLLKPR